MISSEVLDAILSPDAGRRSQAETILQSMSVVQRVQGFMNHLSTTQASSPQTQMLAAVLLRRDILKLTDVNMLKELVSPLLSAFSTSASCKQQVGHCLAEICAILSFQTNAAETVLPTILSNIEGSLKQGDIASLKLLANLADRSPVAFSKIAVPSLPSLVPSSDLSPHATDAWTEILVNSAIATTVKSASLIRNTPELDDLVVDGNSAASSLGPCLAQVLKNYTSAALIDDEDSLRSCLEHLCNAAVTCPSLLAGSQPVLEAFISTCLKLCQESPSSTVRLSALQVLASFISVGDVKRRIFLANRKIPNSISAAVLPVCAQLMADVDDDVEEWAAEPATLVEDAVQDIDDDQAMFAETLFESFLQHMGTMALTIALPLVQQLLSSEDWKHARAGLAMLECGLAATPVSLVSFLPMMVESATKLSASSNLRVQWQAIRLLGVLGEASDPSIRESFAQVILERLAVALASPCTKVSAMASLGLVSFCRGGGEREDLEDASQYVVPFLQNILEALVHGPLSSGGTDTGSVTVRVRAMGATACLAETSGEAFAPFYSSIMPGLLLSAQLPVVEVAGAAVEAATIVGQSVGLELFRNDANQLLSWILPVLKSGNGGTLPLDQLLPACARIASVLGEEFAPHVDIVLPYLLSRAQEPPDVSITEGDEAAMDGNKLDDQEGIESMTVALPGKGFTKVTINTSKNQEKAQATRAVYEHAKAMGAAFGPYVQSCLDVFLPLVDFKYSADVRSTSSQTLAALFESACENGENAGMQIPQKYLPLLASAISKQIVEEDPSDMESMYALADSLSELYYIVYRYRNSPLGRDLLSDFSLQNAKNSVEACMKAMVACLERRSNITRVLMGAMTGEDEKEEYEGLLKLEEELLTPLVDSVGYTLKFFGKEYVPIFEALVVPVLGPFLTSSGSDVRALISALCLFDDCIEHCGQEAAAKYAPQLLQGIMMVLEQASAAPKDLLQPAVYGIAQMSRHAPSNLMAQHVQTIVHTLLSITDCSKEEAGDDIYLVEVAVSALVSLTLFGPFPDLKFANQDLLISRFLNHLPIQQDDDEAKVCHAGLCHLIESGRINLSDEAVRVTQIIGNILCDVEDGEEIATPETCERLTAALQAMGNELPPAMMQHAYNSLGADAQNAIAMAMQELARTRTNLVTP